MKAFFYLAGSAYGLVLFRLYPPSIFSLGFFGQIEILKRDSGHHPLASSLSFSFPGSFEDRTSRTLS